MSGSFLSPQMLLTGGPLRFTRQIERLLGQLGFRDVVNIDGSGDRGGDLLATRGRRLWVFQAKWKTQGSVDSDAVAEVSNAYDHYGASKAVVVTNTKPSTGARQRAQEL